MNTRRGGLKMYKVPSEQVERILTVGAQRLKAVFQKHGYEIRIAGGAVRDLILGVTPHDIDFATTVEPDKMKAILRADAISVKYNTKAESFGTITAVIGGVEYQVTTLIVEKPMGNGYTVEFITDWERDASRRDLTINAMFMDFDGNVYDYVGGYDDLINRRTVFVGEPEDRVKTDAQRIIRYFRFYGEFATSPNAHEERVLNAMRKNMWRLDAVSPVRIWMGGLKKMLETRFAGDLLKTMLNIGIANYIGLPSNPNTAELDRVWARGRNLKMDPMCLLAAVMNNSADVNTLSCKLKFFMQEKALLKFLFENRSKNHTLEFYKAVKIRYGLKYVQELLKYKGDTAYYCHFGL